MTRELELKKFLNTHLALGAFIDNRRSQCPDGPVFEPALLDTEVEIILGSFLWRITSEGADFWARLNDRFNKVEMEAEL